MVWLSRLGRLIRKIPPQVWVEAAKGIWRRLTQWWLQKIIREKVREMQKRNLASTLQQCILLGGAVLARYLWPSTVTWYGVSALAWCLVLYNAYRLFFKSIPKLIEIYELLQNPFIRRMLKFAGISIVSEVVGGASLWLLILVASMFWMRSWLCGWVDWFGPWKALFS